MIKTTKVGETLEFGGALNAREREAVKAQSITPEQIFANLEGLSEEIQESYPQEEEMSSPVQRPVAQKLPPRPVPVPVAPKSRVDQKAEVIRERIPDPEPEQSLDDLLDNPPKAAEEVGATLVDQVRALLDKTHGAPSQATIEQWKQSFGGVYCFALGEGDVYLFTYLKRSQWQRISEVMKDFQTKGGVTGEKYEIQLKEKVVQNCVLFPKPLTPEFFVNSRAGVVDGLFEAIMFHSAFLQPQQVINLTVEL